MEKKQHQDTACSNRTTANDAANGPQYNFSIIPSNTLLKVASGTADPKNASETVTYSVTVTNISDETAVKKQEIFITPIPRPQGLNFYQSETALPIVDDNGDGHYEVSTDDSGKFTVQSTSTQVLFAKTSFAVGGTAADGYDTRSEVVFDSIENKSLDLLAPSIDEIEGDILNLTSPTAECTVRFPPLSILGTFTYVLNINDINYLTAISNTDEVTSNITITLPYANLNTNVDDNHNSIFYFIQDEATGSTHTSSVLQFDTLGIFENVPGQNRQYRTIDEKPYLTNHSYIVNNNDLNGDMPVTIDIEATDNISSGDEIIFTIYLNGFKPGTGSPKSNVINTDPIPISAATISAKHLTVSIPQSELVGYGGDAFNNNNPGDIFIDYTITGNAGIRQPVNYFRGSINTVG